MITNIENDIDKLEKSDAELAEQNKNTEKQFLLEIQLLRQDILDIWKHKSKGN